jgi:hypothetical protein
MLLNPQITPFIRISPEVWVQMKDAIIQSRDLQVRYKVNTSVIAKVRSRRRVAVRITVPGSEPALVTKRDHVIWVQLLDVSRDNGRPVGDYRVLASRTTRLIPQLPGKYGGAVPIARDDSFDIVTVDLLGPRIFVPGVVVAKDAGVDQLTAPVGPVVHQRKNQLQPQPFCPGDRIIEPLDAVFAVVDIATCGIDEMVPYLARPGGLLVWDLVCISETPDADYLVLGLVQVGSCAIASH